MIEHIPQEIITIYNRVRDADFEVYFVGGCVRNLILKRPVKDWDMTTNATPQDLLKIFNDGFYDNKFGTVGVPLHTTEYGGIVEITTFRTEKGFSDKRRPDKVIWGKSIEEDLARRDFTINAIALKGKRKEENFILNASPFTLIDPYDGQQDIKDKLIRAVGNPKERFKEDALRLLRAVRIASENQFSIEQNTWEEIKKDAPLIANISGERIKSEFLRILGSDYALEGVMLLKDSNLLQFFLPELIEGIGISQARPGRHHTTDVFTHNVMSLKYCASKDPIVRFATLLHDVGKPKVMGKDEKGLVTFYNHEIVGARIAEKISERLKFSKKEKERVYNLIRWHMFTVDEKLSDAGIRRFIRRVGVGNVKDMMDLRIGDRLGGGTQTAESWRLKLFKKRVEEQLRPAPFSINDLAIDGNDIMKELKVKPGPKIGQILQKLFEEVDEDLSKNNKEYLLKRTKELSS